MTDSIRVLHVDDEPDFAEMTAQFLEREDERIDTVTETSASDGLNRLADEKIDCIVSDYQMPGMDGLEFLQAIREKYPDLPFLLFTGKGSEAIASDAIAEGATDYLQKQPGPEQYELLANRITNTVEQYRATQRAANLDRIRRVIRDANQALVRAETRDELEQRICEIISDADPYSFAWIGEVDPDAQTVEPRTAAGMGGDYLDTIEVTTDERPTGQGPTGRAVRTRELVALQNIPESAEYEPWREDALERGYRSSAAVPIVYEETLYGVLNVYADRTNAFDKEECDLLRELADDIAHARDGLEVRARQKRLERIIDTLPVGVYRATPEPDGEVVDANPALADMFDADSADTLVGRQVSDFYQHPEKRKAMSDRLQQEGLVQRKELRLETLEGDDIWIEVTAIHTEEDGEVEFGGIIEDITERKKYEQELQRENEWLDEFAGVISHDLRNPLNVAQGRVMLLQQEVESDHIEVIVESLDRMEAIIEDTLTLARQGKFVGEMETIRCRALIENCWKMVETGEATLEITDEFTIRGDFDRLQALCENLFRNAVEHGAADVTVRIGQIDERGFYVEDDGPGIAEEERSQVFEAGYSTAEHGTGLGLTIVKQVVEAHDWEISVTESETGGARFEITDVEVIDS